MEITLSPLTKSDLSFLIEVRNDTSTRFQLGNDSIFTLEECKVWFKKSKPNWLIIKNSNSTKVGYMRVDDNMIGCDIHPNFRRMGYARSAYQKYLKNTSYAELFVFEDNHAKKLYEELGFIKTDEYEMLRGRKYLKMIYSPIKINK